MEKVNIKNNTGQKEPKFYWLVCRVFIPFALGYFLSYLYRTVNAVIGPNLVEEIGLSAGGLGLLTSAYFISFAAAQLPLGFFLDSHGPRRTVSCLLIVASIGALVFSFGYGLWDLALGRALIGLGVAACLMASFKAMGEWFPREKLPIANGFIMASGGLGAITATAPTQYLVANVGWRYGFLVLAISTLVVAIIIWFAVPERERERRVGGLADQISDLKKIYGKRVFWQLAPITALSQGTFLAIQTLWAGPWLRDVAKLEAVSVSFTLLYGAIGFVFGNILIGLIAVRLAKKNIPPIVVVTVGMIFFILVQLLVIGKWVAAPNLLWFVFGMLGSVGVLSFAVLSQSFQDHLTGRASTGMNLLIFLSAFAIQWGIGEIINLWPLDVGGGYAESGYRTAFCIALAMQVLALVWLVYDRRFRQNIHVN